MSIIMKRELQQYGLEAGHNYDVALKMLKSYKSDEYRSLSSPPDPGSEPPVFACRFCKVYSYEHILALANEDGKIAIQNTYLSNSDQSSNMISCTQGHMNAIFDLAWSPHSLRLVSVSGDHTAILWDVTGRSLVPLGIFEGHSRSVKVAAFHPTDINVFATGARDGVVIMWDYRCIQQNATTIKPDNVISNAHCQSGSSTKKTKRREPSRADSITGLVYQDEHHLISCSAGDGLIKVWDTRKCYSVYRRVPQPCYSLAHPGGSAKTAFTCLSVDPGRVRLYANCMDNRVYCYNIASYQSQPVASYVGHQNQTFYIKSCLSGDGRYLVSGSSDEKAYVWNVQRPGPPVAALVGHSTEVTCVDWAENIDGDIKMVTCADDSCHRLWRVRPPTDNDDNTDLVGWVEWLHKGSMANSLTPRAVKRMVSRQERTPGFVEDTKRQRLDELTPIDEEPERQVLAAVQPRTEGKGARRLFDLDNSSHCTGVEMLSPTSNLPNYVIEGTSPYHRCCSSASKQKENWLMKLQATPSPKQAEKVTTKRKSQTITPKVCRGNLLKFFKVEAKQSPINVSNGCAPCEMQKEVPIPKESPSVS